MNIYDDEGGEIAMRIKLIDGSKYKFRELLAMFIVMHLETTTDENGYEFIDEETIKNKRLFSKASKLVGGRENLDALIKKFVKSAAVSLGIAGYDTSDFYE